VTTPPHQAYHYLSSDRQPAGCSATARSHQDRKYRSISGRRS
jgi:hypothetical protein